jgi:nitroreductase
LREDHKQALLFLLEQLNKEATIPVRFVFMDVPAGEEKRQLGTYGFIAGVHQYVAALLDKSSVDALTLGFLFEKLVLSLTDLGIQTCWLGGTFDKDAFAKAAGMLEHEHMPLVTPVGYKKDKARIFESTMRKTIGADKRKPWKDLFFSMDNGSSLSEEEAGEYALTLEMVRLGPSASNKQPWRIVKEKNRYHFFLDRTKGYGVTGYDIQKNDMGIAMFHFEKTADEMGLVGSWSNLEPTPKWESWEYVITWSSVPKDAEDTQSR